MNLTSPPAADEQERLVIGTPRRFDDPQCPSCRARQETQERRRRIRLAPSVTSVIGRIELRAHRAALTLELLPLPSRTDVRLQLNEIKRNGRLKATPLRVTFDVRRLAQVIALLQSAQRMVSEAVPLTQSGDSQ